MAWLQDDGDENEFAQFEEEEDGEPEGVVEEIEEEVIVTERPGVGNPPQPASKARAKSKKKAKPKAKPKARPKKKAAARKKKRPAKAGKTRKKRGRR